MRKQTSYWKATVVFLTILIAAGIASAQTPAPNSGQSSAGPGNAQAGASRPQEYRLCAGDVVEIKFFYNAELNDSIQIRPDGRVALPLVGDVYLAGHSVAEAKKNLEALFAPYVKTPEITLQVRSYASQKAYVGGEVVRPGVVSLAGEMTVLDALMEAGGIKHTGRKSSVILLRKGDDGARVMQVLSLQGEKGQPSQAAGLPLRPFDVILVPETRIARLDRWVDQHLRQTIPLTMTAGFSYLFNGQVVR